MTVWLTSNYPVMLHEEGMRQESLEGCNREQHHFTRQKLRPFQRHWQYAQYVIILFCTSLTLKWIMTEVQPKFIIKWLLTLPQTHNYLFCNTHYRYTISFPSSLFSRMIFFLWLERNLNNPKPNTCFCYLVTPANNMHGHVCNLTNTAYSRNWETTITSHKPDVSSFMYSFTHKPANTDLKTHKLDRSNHTDICI